MLRILLLSILTAQAAALAAQAPRSTDCYEVKYLDFFGLDQAPIQKWPDSELSMMNRMGAELTKASTSFIVPMIACQLQAFHPDCHPDTDLDYVKAIMAIYFKMRRVAPEAIADLTLSQRIDYIRKDFYEQCRSPRQLPHMIMTFDDGPFYGKPVEGDIKAAARRATDFGELRLTDHEGTSVLQALDRGGNLLWQRHLTVVGGKPLQRVAFSGEPLRQTSIATIARLDVGDEAVDVYLGKEGELLFYYHAW